MGVVGEMKKKANKLLSILLAFELMPSLARYLSAYVHLLLGKVAWPAWTVGRKTLRPELPS